ncbi:hypothetical protein LTR62_002335 [Meristemomyces frigidus]|uniref:Velvet domain-containing protein n=1 Tax=Meristemomyces frigidus TaxID=1508187 RepID=A0AAN7YFU6_9PEZI|nr:hypothetical protein LTR62_002335 [Meristemomyces frigidus]
MIPAFSTSSVARIMTEVFSVFTAKNFPVMRASSELLKALRRQGLKVGVKKGLEARKEKGKGKTQKESSISEKTMLVPSPGMSAETAASEEAWDWKEAVTRTTHASFVLLLSPFGAARRLCNPLIGTLRRRSRPDGLPSATTSMAFKVRRFQAREGPLSSEFQMELVTQEGFNDRIISPRGEFASCASVHVFRTRVCVVIQQQIDNVHMSQLCCPMQGCTAVLVADVDMRMIR